MTNYKRLKKWKKRMEKMYEYKCETCFNDMKRLRKRGSFDELYCKNCNKGVDKISKINTNNGYNIITNLHKKGVDK